MAASAPDVSIVTSGHDVADARIHRLCASLGDTGLTIELLGLGDPSAGPPGAAVAAVPRSGAVGRAFLAAKLATRAHGRVIMALDPDSLVAALVVGRLRGVAVVADVHEDYAALLRDRAWASGWRGRVARVLVAFATWAARRADLTVVADTHLPPSRARHRIVLRNLPYLGLLPEPDAVPGPPYRALYVGDVRASRGLWSMVTAVESAPMWSLDIVGPIHHDDLPRLEAYVQHGAARDRLKVHGRLPPKEAWAHASGASCGFVLLDDTPAFRAALPSKLYEYVACGLPVIVTDLPRQREFVEAWQAGCVVPTGAAAGRVAGEVLRDWAEHPDGLERLRAASEPFRDEAGTWEREYTAVSSAVAAIARSRARSH